MNEEMNLSSRWTTREGNELTGIILNLLRKGESSGVTQIAGKHDGRCDLRGFSFPKPKRTGQPIKLKGHKVELISDATEFEGVVVEDVDFSDADMIELAWTRCSFSNCKFDHTRLDDAAFFDCRISKCVFVNSNLTGCVLGGHIGNHSGELMDSVFKDGMFKDVVFAFPRIERCKFDCNITNVDFNGSQLTDCWFTGRLDKVIFRRRPGESVTDKATWARLRPENRMENVDFSEASLYDVDFWNGVDLTKCRLPRKRGLFLVLDGPSVFAEARKEIESSWKGEERRIGLGFTINYYLDRIKSGQRHFLVDEESIIEDWGKSLGLRYSALIRRIAQSQGFLRELCDASESRSHSPR